MTNPDLDEVSVQHRRTLLIAGVLSAVVLLVGVGVALAVLAHRPAATKPPITPAEETSESPEVAEESSASVVATQAATSTPTTTVGPSTHSTTPTPTGVIVRSGRIAYRLGGQVWVSSEDGSGAKAVYTSSTGAYTLSPDGRTLVVASSPTTYVLVDVASLAQFPLAGPIDLPVWSPDSSWLAYTARTATGGYLVRRVNRTGSADTTVTAGARPQIAPDGRRIAVAKSIDPGPTDPVQVYDKSAKPTLHNVPSSRGALTFTWAPGGILYFAKGPVGAVPGWLGVTDKAVTKSSVVASLTLTDPPSSPGALYPNPDGTKVLFALSGDDGHSRMYVADTTAKKIKAISTRYDAYPKGWLLDGSAVLYIEGNAFQGEATSLYRIRPDGTKRTVVVTGAGL